MIYPNRQRSDTAGASSAGSALQYDHGLISSTTDLSTSYELPELSNGQPVIGSKGLKGKVDRAHDHIDNHRQQRFEGAEEAADKERGMPQGPQAMYLQPFNKADEKARQKKQKKHNPVAFAVNQMKRHGKGSDNNNSNHQDGIINLSENNQGLDNGDDNDDGEEEEEEDGDTAAKRKKMGDLKGKFRRAVIKASAMTRKPPRQMRSAFTGGGMFPFLQDSVFVPMFYFMRDEHGRRAPSVIFDAIRLNVSVAGGHFQQQPQPQSADAGSEEEHHFLARIELQYGDIKWVIYRRLNDFLSLHTMLTLRRFQGRMTHQLPAFPQLFSYAIERARTFKPGHSHQKTGDRMDRVTTDRKQALENYLINVLKALNMRPAYEVCTFLELSAISISKDVGWKGKEGNLDRRVEHTTGMWCTPRDLRRWSRQWVIVRDSFIAFCDNIADPYPSDVLFADPQFDMKYRKKTGHNPLFPYRITVSNQYRRIQLRSDSERVINEWKHSIQEMKSSSAWAVPHRFASFAPIRDMSRVIWFVDGDDYFYAVSEALENATDCIYIEDWWLSPELHLRRPYHLNEEYRIDRLLKRKAEEGIKIYVVVYKEVTVSLTINSAYTKRKLQSLHPNIMVQRHPDHLAGGTMFWAHHEKMVIVDNTFAFIGGLDLCWGRYDTHGHRLADYFPPHKDKTFGYLQNFFGQDYNNARIHDFADVNEYWDTLIDRRNTPRMPWHDVHMAMIGQPARDVARHFIQRWNFIKGSKGMAKTWMPFLMPKGEYSATRNDMQYRGTCRTQVLRSSAEWSMGINKESSIHTAYCEMIRDAKHFIYIENQFFISNARDDPDYTIKNRIAEALVDRIKRAHRKKEKFRVMVLIPLMPAFQGDVNAAGAATLKLVMHWQYQSICRGDHSIASQLNKEGINMHDYIRFFGLRNYDVIRNVVDGPNATRPQQDLSAVIGNAPQESPGFDEELRLSGAPAIVRSPGKPQPQVLKQTPPKVVSYSSESSVAKVPAPAPPNQHNHTNTLPAAEGVATSVSFGSPYQPSNSNGKGYFFQRPDEAFANDSFPMQDNPSRFSQEISSTQRSKEAAAAAAAKTTMAKSSSSTGLSKLKRNKSSILGLVNKGDGHTTPPPPPPLGMAGRRSFNLPRKRPTLKQRSSFSGFRTFFKGDKESRSNTQRQQQQQQQGNEEDSRSVTSTSSSSVSSLDLDLDGRMHRIDTAGRRKTALNYLVRGTEHIKQYGRPRMPGRNQTASHKLHKRIHKYGMQDMNEQRDSDSEFSASRMQVNMADVDNYVHPPQRDIHKPTLSNEPTFLSERSQQKQPQQQGDEEDNMPEVILPEMTGTEYMREVKLLDEGKDVELPKIVDLPSPSLEISGNKQRPLSSEAAYPPKPPLGPQVLEHVVFSKDASAKKDTLPNGSEPQQQQPVPLSRSPRVTGGAVDQQQEPLAEEDIVHVDPELAVQIVTELVYIHCKLMIVDDRYVIMGSANINDRSMVGNRDSEIAMVVEDTQPVVTAMNGRPYQAAKFAHSLRVQLCQEHTGLLETFDQMRYVNETFAGKPPMDVNRSDEEKEKDKLARKLVEDPLSDEFMDFWWNTATTNERAFREVFRCVPDDTVESFDQYKKFIPGPEVPHGHALPGKPNGEVLESLKKVKGHIVPIPLNFLKSENLGAKLGDKEMLVPVEVFT